MKIKIENTSKIASLKGTPARVWRGHTESGIPVVCFLTAITVDKNDPRVDEFKNELIEQDAPDITLSKDMLFIF